MKKYQKNVIALVAFTFISSFLFVIFIQKSSKSNSRNNADEQMIVEAPTNVMLVIDDGYGIPTSYYAKNENLTVYELLTKAEEENVIMVESEQYDFGIFIKSINKLESNAEKSWIYFVNGQSGQVAADQMELNPGDVVEWKYITPTENDQ